MFWKLDKIEAHANIGLDFSTKIWVGFVVLIPSLMGHSQWWHLIMAKARSFCHLEVKIQEPWWLFIVVCVFFHCQSCFWVFVQCQALSFYLSSLLLCLLIFAFAYICLFMFTSIFFYFSLFASIFVQCFSLFSVCFYFLLFAYV